MYVGENSIHNQSSCSSLPASRQVLREINAQARFEALHRDSECRRMRRESGAREKLERDEEAARKLLPDPGRGWEQKWCNEQPVAYARKLRNLAEKRQAEASAREDEELRECRFAPRLIARDAPRQRRLLKARQLLEGLAGQQREWAMRLEALHSQEEAFQCGPPALDAQQRAVAERRCRIGFLQVLHELTRLESEALSLASRASRHPAIENAGARSRGNAEAARLAELCPAFDLGLLPRLRQEVAGFTVPDADYSWEVPGALLRPPLPVPAASAPMIGSGVTPDEARPWTWR